MNAKGKTDATAGKQKRTAKGAKSVEAAPQTQSFNSLGEFHPSKFSAPDKGRDMRKQPSVNADEGAEGEWPTMLRIAPDEFHESKALAELAIQLCTLKKEENLRLWEQRKKRFSERKAKDDEEKTRFDDEWRKLLSEEEAISTPAYYLAEARKLIEKAREQVTRPQTELEFLIANANDPEAHLAARSKWLRENPQQRVAFSRLCNPARNRGDLEPIEITREDGSVREVTWHVYAGKEALRQFEKMFWKYVGNLAKCWRLWVQGKECQSGFPAFTNAALNSKEKRGETAKNETGIEWSSIAFSEEDAAKWNARWSMILTEWIRDGVPLADFLLFEAFRRKKIADKFRTSTKSGKAKITDLTASR